MAHLRSFGLPLLIGLTACANAVGSDQLLVTIDQLVSSPEAFDGKIVRVDACLFVTFHGMSLYNCQYHPGQFDQLVSFDRLPGVGDRAYSRLVGLGHEGFAAPKFEVRAQITGVYIYREQGTPALELLIMNASRIKKIPEET